MSPRRFEKMGRTSLILLCSLVILGCVSWGQAFVLSFANLERLVDDTFGPPKNVTPELGATAPAEAQPGPGSPQATRETVEPTALPVPPADQMQPTDPPASQGSVAACDAVRYVKVTLADRHIHQDDCFQYVMISNLHPEKQIAVIAHTGSSSDGLPLADFRLPNPGQQIESTWSYYDSYDSAFLVVDWYAAVFVVPDCMWIFEEHVHQEDASRLEDLSALGLAVQPIEVPSCNP